MNFGFQACRVQSFKQSKLSRVAEYVREDKEKVSATVCKIFNCERANGVGIYSVINTWQLLKFHFAVTVERSF